MAPQDQPLPLEGVRVCDFTWIVAGPQATRILADMGAEVIKVENESSLDALRGSPGLHNNFHRNKLAITANIHHPKGREVVERLIAASDIVIENFSTGTLARMGFPYERLQELRSDIIYISLSGYGQVGRDSGFGTWGPTAQGASGLTAMSRLPGQPPAGWGYSYLDHTGGFYGAIAALMALWHRERTRRRPARRHVAGRDRDGPRGVADAGRPGQRAALRARRQPLALARHGAARHLPLRGRGSLDRDRDR